MPETNYDQEMAFFVDMQRCIGCHACEMACAECETNGQESMIHVNYVDRAKVRKLPFRCVCIVKILPVPMFVRQMLYIRMNSGWYILPTPQDV